MSDTRITLRIECDWNLMASEVWPDGLPETVDAAAVVEAFKRHLSVVGMLTDWNLATDLVVDVDVWTPNPEFTQDEALFPEHAASPEIHSWMAWPC